MRMLSVFKFFSLCSIIAVTSFQAHAISFRFKAKTISSGPDIWACNAGIAVASLDHRVCYFGGNPKNGRCTETDCRDAKTNCNSTCKCIDMGKTGESWFNKLLVNASDYTGNHSDPLPKTPLERVATGTVFNSVFSGRDAWRKNISDVITHYKTEAYTGSFFVDICYKGSKLNTISQANFNIRTQAAAIPFVVADERGFMAGENNREGLNFQVLGETYARKADLSVQRFVVCGETEDRSEFLIDQSTGAPYSAVSGAGYYNATSETRLSAAVHTKTHPDVIDPKFCKVRYIFRENNWKSEFPLFRDNTAEGAELCTHTHISDPPRGYKR